MTKQIVEDGDILQLPNGLQYKVKDYGGHYLLVSLDNKATIGPLEGYTRLKMYFLDQGAKITKRGGDIMQFVDYIRSSLSKLTNFQLAETIKDAQGRIESHMIDNPKVDDYVERQQKIIDLALEELDKRR